MSKTAPWTLAPEASTPLSPIRHCAGSLLLRLAFGLWRLSRRMRPGAVTAVEPPLLEFHAEAGAPEGALFVDGVRVGTVMGVRRL